MSDTQYGFKVFGTVKSVRGHCFAGHQEGDTFELSYHRASGLCGGFYHDIFAAVTMLQFGGEYPWGDKDVIEVECPDRENLVKLELRRVRA